MGAGNWYPFSDRDLGGNSIAQLNIINDSSVTGVTGVTGVTRGKVIRFDATIKKDFSNYYAGCGLFLGLKTSSINTFFNLSKMTSFEFKARANTSRDMKVFFGTYPILIPTKLKGFYATVKLTDQWNTFSIPSDSLQAKDNSTQPLATWAKASAKTNQIQFNPTPSTDTATDTVSIWLSNLYFNGMNGEDLYK